MHASQALPRPRPGPGPFASTSGLAVGLRDRWGGGSQKREVALMPKEFSSSLDDKDGGRAGEGMAAVSGGAAFWLWCRYR